MILYLDIFIDDNPLYARNVISNQSIRNSCNQYKMPKKIDITKYTLASYAEIPWTNIIIKYDAVIEEDAVSFLEYTKELFPNADISRPCSNNQATYGLAVEKITALDDDFVFYSPNNDHPFIGTDLGYFGLLLEKAIKFQKYYEFVSLVYSHLSEFINAPIAGSPFYNRYSHDTQIIEDDEIATSFIRFKGDNSSCQIVNKRLLNYWFCSHDLGDERIIRAEDVRQFFITPNQLMIVPKKELCAHFDGYSHTVGGPVYISSDQVPPLFIPIGFWNNSIKIAYGYSEYREGWVNINPSAKQFSFRDQKYGTDLKIELQDIPLFWKNRIGEIDINKNADFEALENGRKEYFKILMRPWG